MLDEAQRLKPKVVLTVDDHPLIRTALREVLRAWQESIELIETSNPEEGLAAIRQRPEVDLILLDLTFAGHDGIAFVSRFRAAAPAAPLVVYTMHEDEATLKRVLACGAAGLIPKTHSSKLLQKAIELVMEGGIYVPPNFARGLAQPEPAPHGPMSEQQRRIVELLVQGFPNKEIARKLGIAPNTVKNQLTVVFQILGASNRTQAAIAARALLGRGADGETRREDGGENL
jgi:DNA-binding NarL/FixJ family response regulator